MIESVSDARMYFHRNTRPIYFISATNFNLLGIDKWVKNFKYINLIDCFDGRHPNIFVPSKAPVPEFEGIEDINNYLLQNKEVLDYIGERKPGLAVFLMFDKKTESLARQVGLKVAFPRAKLRSRLDNKIKTVRIGDRAGVRSVPNVLARVGSYKKLKKITKKLGRDLVVQTAYGDSGHTTFFISEKKDWNRHADEIGDAGEVKIMKRINCRQAAIEACATRCGTVVGPLMTEIVGFGELTPYRGGWAGNETYPRAFSRKVTEAARDMTFRFGQELWKIGYKGYFELDFLVDTDTDDVWLGELNPRVAGTSALTTMGAFAFADMPLFLFHLLEYCGQDFNIDVDRVNARWSKPENVDTWSQLVLKYRDDEVRRVTAAPESGIYRLLQDGSVVYDRFDTSRANIDDETEGFFMRITGVDDFVYEGADLGILTCEGRMMNKKFKLNGRARKWIDGLNAFFQTRPLDPFENAPEAVSLPEAFKLL